MSENLSIGPFVLLRSPLGLWFGGAAVPLHASALEVLAAVAQGADGVSAAALWPLVSAEPGSPVDEDRLCGIVGDINTALGGRSPAWYVAWYPEDATPRFALVDATRRATPMAALPARRTDVVGREDAIARTIDQLASHRFVTLLGTGGLGKTTVALAVAHAAASDYPDGVFLVDLAPVVDGRLVAQRVATALGFATSDAEALSALQHWAGERRALILLDSCEHVIDAASGVAEALAGSGSRSAVLATSREPLRARGEWLHRLAPMRLPQPGAALSASDAARFDALRLFVDRARAVAPGFVLRDDDVAPLVSLCTRLDGIALAIEIVAARVDTLGLAGLAGQLESRLLGLPARHADAPARHGTLSALLDWSFQLLSGTEQRVLRRLSVFRNGFTMAAATEVAADAAAGAADVEEAVLDLVAKSLVAPVRDGERLRLLDTTRAYARAKLADAGEHATVGRRHALWLAAALADADSAWSRMSRPQWVDRHAPLIDDARAALDWAFSPEGDLALGVELTIASFPLGRQMLLADEFTRQVELAIERVAALEGDRAPGSSAAPSALQLRLHVLSGCLGTAGHVRAPALVAMLEAPSAEILAAIGPVGHFSIVNSMWALSIRRGDFRTAGGWAERLVQLAADSDEPIAHLVSGRIHAQTLHFQGRHAEASAGAQRVIGEAWRTIPLAWNPNPVELRVSMRMVLARALWMQGFPERAAAMAREAMEHARTDSPMAQCQAIAMGALVIALWSGLDDAARALSDRLLDIDAVRGFSYWLPWGLRFRDVLALRAGAHAPPLERPDFFDEPDPVLADHLATLDERWLTARCVARVETGLVGWCAPEALRLQGLRALREPAGDATARGEALLQRSLALAREQGAASWALRTATSLARHWHAHDRGRAARALLEPVLGGFSEGFETADWRAANGLLATL